ncbi:hypothetical protein KZZ52_42130 [Dactylosporangium sp. AC04546]|uniref:hypothetical protein n=1 Tax=Dactylosporangium sp. AC04546 TaxID=2862460 RepID=UPI001EDC9655|nr:hypothetical protein [Dactylosporangium sp. AC04546]WVK89895.1 hypothetical protein KZZ52_42130 [Dactylosporangium sp. AC04546]
MVVSQDGAAYVRTVQVEIPQVRDPLHASRDGLEMAQGAYADTVRAPTPMAPTTLSSVVGAADH